MQRMYGLNQIRIAPREYHKRRVENIIMFHLGVFSTVLGFMILLNYVFDYYYIREID